MGRRSYHVISAVYDDLTPLELAFEKKLWLPAHALAEHQIKHETSPVLLQECFFRAMREQGGVDFLPHLLDLRKRYFPDLNLNFSADTGGRTPWWYLLNSNDPNVMLRALQTLKTHSINPMQLLTHTERQTKLVEEAADKNKLLLATIQMVADQHHSSEDQDAADGDETSSYSEGESQDCHTSSTHNILSQQPLTIKESSDNQKNSTTLHSHMSCTWDAENQQRCSNPTSPNTFHLPPQESVDNQHPEAEVGSPALLSTEFSEDSSCESSSRSDTTPPEADDELSSSDGSAVKHKRTMPGGRKRGVTNKEKKSPSLTPSKCSVYLICAL